MRLGGGDIEGGKIYDIISLYTWISFKYHEKFQKLLIFSTFYTFSCFSLSQICFFIFLNSDMNTLRSIWVTSSCCYFGFFNLLLPVSNLYWIYLLTSSFQTLYFYSYILLSSFWNVYLSSGDIFIINSIFFYSS